MTKDNQSRALRRIGGSAAAIALISGGLMVGATPALAAEGPPVAKFVAAPTAEEVRDGAPFTVENLDPNAELLVDILVADAATPTAFNVASDDIEIAANATGVANFNVSAFRVGPVALLPNDVVRVVVDVVATTDVAEDAVVDYVIPEAVTPEPQPGDPIASWSISAPTGDQLKTGVTVNFSNLDTDTSYIANVLVNSGAGEQLAQEIPLTVSNTGTSSASFSAVNPLNQAALTGGNTVAVELVGGPEPIRVLSYTVPTVTPPNPAPATIKGAFDVGVPTAEQLLAGTDYTFTGLAADTSYTAVTLLKRYGTTDDAKQIASLAIAPEDIEDGTAGMVLSAFVSVDGVNKPLSAGDIVYVQLVTPTGTLSLTEVTIPGTPAATPEPVANTDGKLANTGANDSDALPLLIGSGTLFVLGAGVAALAIARRKKELLVED